MDAVGAEQNLGRDSHAVLEPGLDAVALVGEADEAVTEMDALGRKARGDDREQVGTVNSVRPSCQRRWWVLIGRTASRSSASPRPSR